MNILSVEQARAIWLFPAADINPSGKYLYPLLMDLVKRYKFANLPNIAEAIKNNQGILLGNGVYTHSKRGELHAELGIYNDGLVGDTKADTEASETFLDDLLTWVQKEYGLQYPKNIRKQYGSKLYVETKKSLNSLNPKLGKFANAISAKSKALGKLAYELGGVNFTAEQTGPLVPAVFRFERAEKGPYSDNRYYSFAGLSTADHLELLDQLETILG